MDKQPCRGNVKNCEIVYSGNPWNRKSNDAQDKTQDCKSKFPVVAAREIPPMIIKVPMITIKV